MVQTREYFEEMLAELEQRLQAANKELSMSPNGRVVQVRRGDKYSYFRVETVDGKRIRKVITKNPELVRALARKSYLEAEIRLIRRDISALEQFCKAYREPTHDNILSELPPHMLKYDMEPRGCKDCDEWTKAPYRKSSYMPEKKIHTTSKGLKVRSKSELLIAEQLYRHDIAFRYEQLLDICGVTFAPDFTIRSESGSMIYWEHCGMTSSREYMERHWHKMVMYQKAGIVPWKNLIVTYDNDNGILNLAIVESEIINKIKA